MSQDKTVIVRVENLPAATHQENAYLTVIAGKTIGRMFKLVGDDILIGRSSEAHICLDDDGVSRRHARLERLPDGRLRLVDLDSTNGTWFDGHRVGTRILRDGDKIQIGSATILKFSYQDAFEEQFQQQLYQSATRDGLTRLYNKRFFLDRMEQEFAYSQRFSLPLSLLLFDVDHFKSINDTWGHPAGDAVLLEVATRIGATLRTEDLFCRYGGEEFAIVMRDLTAEKAFKAAERIRRLVEQEPFRFAGGTVSVTISIGVATLADGRPHSTEALIAEADRYLYEAKQQGRNRVCARIRPRP